MWSKIKSLPLTVKMAIVFLTLLVAVGVAWAPHIVIPILLIIGAVGSLMRVFVYLIHRV